MMLMMRQDPSVLPLRGCDFSQMMTGHDLLLKHLHLIGIAKSSFMIVVKEAMRNLIAPTLRTWYLKLFSKTFDPSWTANKWWKNVGNQRYCKKGLIINRKNIYFLHLELPRSRIKFDFGGVIILRLHDGTYLKMKNKCIKKIWMKKITLIYSFRNYFFLDI